ncbi:MAG: rubredoxin [Candidatus Hydrogenedentes bacterium]|nr:rubredoxin [Candidatus Hydrogenedentota bacterium]
MRNQASDMILHTAGGRIPLSVLRHAAELTMVHGNGTMALGSRQELILGGIQSSSRDRIRRELGGLLVEHHPRRPNIVTTRPMAGRAGRTPWLSDGAYDSVLSQFMTAPAIPVNLSDPRQDVLPLYTGQINFIASTEPGYWHVSFNARGQLRPIVLSTAVHADGVPAATFVVQSAILQDNALDLPELQRNLLENLGGVARELPQVAVAHHDEVRPIEGFEFDAKSESYSLGISALAQRFPCAFLADLCLVARSLGLATAGLTPWRSLLMHGIPASARADFERLLLRHRVSLHTGAWDSASFNDFHTPGTVKAGAELLRALNENFPHPGGLRIGLTEHSGVIPDTPIVVRAETPPARWPFRPEPRFNVFVRENFDRFNPMLIACVTGVAAGRMADAVLDLVERFGAGQAATVAVATQASPVLLRGGALIHQCAECHTEYSEQYGDPLGGIDAGTPFAELPASWTCPTCGAPQGKYITTREHAA